MFARSIGDANPKYYEEKDENVIAPPTFIQSSAQFDPDYFLRPKIGGDNWFGSGKEATGMKSSGSGSGGCLLYTSPSPRDGIGSRMPSSA